MKAVSHRERDSMREIQASAITEAVREMCMEANYTLSQDMRERFEESARQEKSPSGDRFSASWRRI